MNQPLLIPVAPGELLDKITILEIKADQIQDAEKSRNVRRELELLEGVWKDYDREDPDILALKDELRDINQALWTIEDDIRDCEARKDFSDTFVQLARAVYRTNDQRAAIKKAINLKLESDIIEEKSYRDY